MSDDLVEAFYRLVRTSLLDKMNTCTVGQIETYDYKTRKATVIPSIKKVFTDGTVLEYKAIPDVPVLWLGTKQASIRFPLKKGDYVILLITQRSIDTWLYKGGVVAPLSTRSFDICDAIAIPGILPFNENSDDSGENENIEIFYKGSNVMIKPNGDIRIDTGKCSIVLSSDSVDINNGNLTIGV